MTEPVQNWHEFNTGEALAEALAIAAAQKLAAAIEARGAALIAVSGGTTPALFFDALSHQKLAWEKVTVTLVDERFVPTSSSRSNARLVARHLLQNEAARAEFTGLYSECASIEETASRASRALISLPLPLDVVVLGMGTDRHTASFFPDAENIKAILDAETGPSVLSIHAPSAGEPRLSLSLPRIVEAGFIALHIEGIDKKQALQEALATPPGPASPIRAVIEKAVNPVQIYWAPKQDAKP